MVARPAGAGRVGQVRHLLPVLGTPPHEPLTLTVGHHVHRGHLIGRGPLVGAQNLTVDRTRVRGPPLLDDGGHPGIRHLGRGGHKLGEIFYFIFLKRQIQF